MVKNLLIGFLVVLLIVAGIFIVRDLVREDAEMTESVEEAEVIENRETETPAANTEETLQPEEEAQIIGHWQKDDDPQNTLTFQADGALIDSYGGGAIYETGTYNFVDSTNDLPPDAQYDAKATYLRQAFGNQSYYYKVLVLDRDSLEFLPLSGETRILKYIRVDS